MLGLGLGVRVTLNLTLGLTDPGIVGPLDCRPIIDQTSASRVEEEYYTHNVVYSAAYILSKCLYTASRVSRVAGFVGLGLGQGLVGLGLGLAG